MKHLALKHGTAIPVCHQHIISPVIMNDLDITINEKWLSGSLYIKNQQITKKLL